MYIPKALEEELFNSADAGAGTAHLVINFTYKTVVATFTGSGATTFVIQGSNDGTNWVTLDTMTDSDYYETDMAVKWIRGNITTAGGKTVEAHLTANR